MSLTITLDPDTERRLESLAAEADRTRSQLMREMIAAGLSAVESYYLGEQARQRAGLVCVMAAERNDLVANE